MANPQNSSPKPKTPEAKRALPSVPETEAVPTTSEAVSAEPASPPVEAVTPPVVQAPSTALAIAVEMTSSGAKAEDFDPTLWSQKSIDLWAENATALLDFTERLAGAKTLDEVTSLQSRFVSERFDALLRQSNELMTLAQRLLNISIAPLYGARTA